MIISTQSHHKIEQLFDAYSRALENYDSKGMAFHYSMPCMLTADDNTLVFNEPSKLEGLFNQGIGFYKQFGIANTRAEIWSKRQWSDKITVVKLNWKYMDQDFKVLYDCDYNYVLHKNKHDEWKIQMAVAINEKERMEEWLKNRHK